jgi:hypothetical protein
MVLVSQAALTDCRKAARRRRDAARRYRPDRIRLLLVAHMPPHELDRYFYFPQVSKADYLFQAVVPHLLGETPARLDKRPQLAALRDRGMFLIDFKPDPCDRRPLVASAADLVRRASRHEPEHAILIKVDVYDDAFRLLREAGVPVVDRRMPFPSTGRQTEFHTAFRAALDDVGMPSRFSEDGGHR